MKILCIGDSLTKGFPYDEKSSYTSILTRETSHRFDNFGENGETSRQILKRVTKDNVFVRDYDKAIILCGANDFIMEDSEVIFVLASILQMGKLCKDNNIKPYIVSPILSVPKMALEKWLDTPGIDYNKVNNKLVDLKNMIQGACNDFGFEFIDLQSSYLDFNKYTDGIHPTEDGYRYIAKELKRGLGL